MSNRRRLKRAIPTAPRRPDPAYITTMWEVDFSFDESVPNLVIPEWLARIILAKAEEGDVYANRVKMALIRPDGTKVVDDDRQD